MKKMRLISGFAAATLAITGFGGCNKSESKGATEIVTETECESESEKYVSVYIYQDTAVVFPEGYEIMSVDAKAYIYEDAKTYGAHEKFYGNDIFYIRYKDKEELEDKIEAFIGEEGNITYYDEIGKSKTLN